MGEKQHIKALPWKLKLSKSTFHQDASSIPRLDRWYFLECVIEQFHILFSCRTLVSRLEEVNPRNMKHEEKLAFWINVHNALAMHVKFLNPYSALSHAWYFSKFTNQSYHLLVCPPQALLVYGISANNVKRMSSVLKVSWSHRKF